MDKQDEKWWLKSFVLIVEHRETIFAESKLQRPLIWLRTKSGSQIPAFHLDNQSKVTVLFSHGNAEDLGMIYEWFVNFGRELRVNVFAYDYEGYGKTTGLPSENGCYEDIDAAFAYLIETEQISSENIVLYGRSLGSGPTLYLAERLAKSGIMKIGGVILQSPLMSVYRVAFPFRFTFYGDMFPNIDRIPHINCPVFIVHGTKDEVIPFWNGEQLFFAAPVSLRAKPYWIDGAGHNNLEVFYRNESTFLDQFKEFFIEWIPAYGPLSKSESANIRNANRSSGKKSHRSRRGDANLDV